LTANSEQAAPLGNTPPPLREPRPAGGAGETARTAFEQDYGPLVSRTLAGVADALLKRPGRVNYELTQKESAPIRMRLLALCGACLAIYGLVMACFSGGQQWWAVPLKLTAGTLLSALICLPSLYVFTALAGGRLLLREVWGLLLMALSLASLLLIGFAPVAWLFAQSTGTAAWMGFLHLLFWIAALGFGFRLLRTSFEFLNGRQAGVLRLWALVFLAVVFQMSTCLRPLVGPYERLDLGKKMFFIAHWVDSMK
jgi:hypothetical protein